MISHITPPPIVAYKRGQILRQKRIVYQKQTPLNISQIV